MSNKKEHNFQIGQIIYLLSEEAEAIVPAIVVEEQVVKKLDGNSISWKVAVGPSNKRKEIDSTSLKGELHTSLEDIREVMTLRLTAFVNNLIDQAKKRTETWYGQHIMEKAKNDGSGGKIDPAALMNSIDGGDDMFLNKKPSATVTTVVQPQNEQNTFKVKAPTISGPLRQQGIQHSSNAPMINIDPTDPRANLKQQLFEMALPDDEDMQDSGVGNGEFVVTEDGRKVPVKFNIKE